MHHKRKNNAQDRITFVVHLKKKINVTSVATYQQLAVASGLSVSVTLVEVLASVDCLPEIEFHKILKNT